MTFHVFAFSPKGERIELGLGHRLLEHALEDRDELRAAYLRKASNWTVEVEDGSGVLMDWKDCETSPTAGTA